MIYKGIIITLPQLLKRRLNSKRTNLGHLIPRQKFYKTEKFNHLNPQIDRENFDIYKLLLSLKIVF